MIDSKAEIIVVKTAADVVTRAAQIFSEAAEKAIAERGQFLVALSGGSTPRGLYELLGSETWRNRIKWDAVHLFWSDERAVAPRDKDSNYGMAHEALMAHISIPAANVHRMKAERASESDAAARRAAEDYAREMRGVFKLSDTQVPRFDLILLGMGADGHTASLFPGTRAVNEQAKLVAGVYVEKLNSTRLTLTFPVINHAARVLFLVTGADKAACLQEVLHSESNASTKYPVQLVKPLNGKLTWLIDSAAAQSLNLR